MFYQFQYANGFDYFMLFVGTLSAAICGAAMPILFIIFGDLTTSFVGYGRFSICLDNFTICNEEYGTNFTSQA